MEYRTLVRNMISYLRSLLPKDFSVITVPLADLYHVPVSTNLDSTITIQLTHINCVQRIGYERISNMSVNDSLLASRLIKYMVTKMLNSKINCYILMQAKLFSEPVIYCTDCHVYIREEQHTLSSLVSASVQTALVLPGSYLKRIPNRLKTILDLGSQGYSKISMSIKEATEIIP